MYFGATHFSVQVYNKWLHSCNTLVNMLFICLCWTCKDRRRLKRTTLVAILLILIVGLGICLGTFRLMLQPPYRNLVYSRYCVRDHETPTNDSLPCIKTRTKPWVYICTYQVSEDVFISKPLMNSGVWETEINEEIIAFLKSDNDTGFIDIGANLGFHSLVVAKCGWPVVALEPDLGNRQRLYRSLLLNQLQNTTVLLENAVYNKRTKVSLVYNSSDRGRYSVLSEEQIPKISVTTRASTIVLDDLLEVLTFRKAVIKIDTAGFEHRAFAHSDKLLSHLHVSAIIMKFEMLKKYFELSRYSEDYKLVSLMIKTLIGHGFTARVLGSRNLLSLDNYQRWPATIVWVHNTTTSSLDRGVKPAMDQV